MIQEDQRKSVHVITQIWGRLPFSHIGCIQDREEVHIGTLQTRYGWSREKAQSELHRRLVVYAEMWRE
ncbi:MAG: hypothetical protein KF893_16590 [Caldilineaceae bacterium]|nr:hypothetical protein [Caldilineaceae bacterium]